MRDLLLNRITAVWLVLIVATALSFQMGHGMGFGDARQASVAILIVSFIKVRLVILDFMEVRHAPHFMRIIAEVWVLLLCAALIVLFLWAGDPQSGR